MEAVGRVVGVVIGFALAGHAAWMGRQAWRRRDARGIHEAAASCGTRVVRPPDEE